MATGSHGGGATGHGSIMMMRAVSDKGPRITSDNRTRALELAVGLWGSSERVSWAQ